MIFASDLDRTLIYSKQAFFNDRAPLDVKQVEMLDGEEISYMTHRAIRLLRAIARQAIFIPVTTRTTAQYERIHLFQGEIKPTYAVTCNGANILEDGKLDEDWQKQMKQQLQSCTLLADVQREFSRIQSKDWVHRSKTAEDIFIYHIVDPATVPVLELQQFTTWLSAQNWVFSQQGRKLYMVPKVVSKGAAVSYLQKKTGVKSLIAAGDSLLDVPMLRLADVAIYPRHGELQDHETYILTQAAGILAGEEILSKVVTYLENNAGSPYANQ